MDLLASSSSSAAHARAPVRPLGVCRPEPLYTRTSACLASDECLGVTQPDLGPSARSPLLAGTRASACVSRLWTCGREPRRDLFLNEGMACGVFCVNVSLGALYLSGDYLFMSGGTRDGLPVLHVSQLAREPQRDSTS